MRQALAEERPERLGAATASGADQRLQRREAQLDWIEVRAIGRQIPERGPGSLDGSLDTGDLVRAEVVGDDEVARGAGSAPRSVRCRRKLSPSIAPSKTGPSVL